jgi:hypothetical protein
MEIIPIPVHDPRKHSLRHPKPRTAREIRAIFEYD